MGDDFALLVMLTIEWLNFINFFQIVEALFLLKKRGLGAQTVDGVEWVEASQRTDKSASHLVLFFSSKTLEKKLHSLHLFFAPLFFLFFGEDAGVGIGDWLEATCTLPRYGEPPLDFVVRCTVQCY